MAKISGLYQGYIFTYLLLKSILKRDDLLVKKTRKCLFDLRFGLKYVKDNLHFYRHILRAALKRVFRKDI